MPSAPKETTTKTEPWDGAKPYILEQYKLADKLFKEGAPKQWEGKNIAAQSDATKDALKGMENLARNGDTSALTNATKTINGVMNQTMQAPGSKTLADVAKGIDLGKNPTDKVLSNIANGKTDQAPGKYDQNYVNPATAQAKGLSGYTNDAGKTAAGLQNYNNSAIGNIQSMLGFQNPAMQNASQFQNFQNSAVGQAANLGNFTNAAAGLQTQQANQLQNSNNPAMDMLKNTASGAEVGKNAYLDQMVSNQQDRIADKLKNVTNPGIDSSAVAAGRMGSGAYASQRNTAEGAAASEMAKVATDMYGNQYNVDKDRQMNAAGQYGNFANQDVANRMQANANLANTSNQEQAQRISGIGLSGELQNAQNQARMQGSEMYGNMASQNYQNNLNAATQLGQLNDSQQNARLQANQNFSSINDSQQSQRLAATQLFGNLNDSQQNQRFNAANAMNDQFNQNRNYQMQGINQLSNNYNSNIANMLSNNNQRLDAANAQNSYQLNSNNQKLQAADMAGQAYQNQYMPYQTLAGIGQQKDDRSSLELQAQIDAFNRKETQPVQNVANFLNMLNGGGYQNTTQPVYSNTMGQVGGLMSGLAGLFALCTRTAKIVHSLVGHMPLTNGASLPIYSFSYIDDPDQKIWMGPIAEELEEELPEAVVEIDGRKHIDVASFMQEAA